jgi:hypothetical protein
MKRKLTNVVTGFVAVTALTAVYLKGRYDASNGERLQII